MFHGQKDIHKKLIQSYTIFDRLFKHVKIGQKQDLMYAQKKELGNGYLNPISTGLFYLVVELRGEGSTPFHKI